MKQLHTRGAVQGGVYRSIDALGVFDLSSEPDPASSSSNSSGSSDSSSDGAPTKSLLVVTVGEQMSMVFKTGDAEADQQVDYLIETVVGGGVWAGCCCSRSGGGCCYSCIGRLACCTPLRSACVETP